MSIIKELLKKEDSVLVFDVDGVLAKMEFGNHNHFVPEEEWHTLLRENQSLYTRDRVSKRMRNFINSRDINRIYIITRTEHNNETQHKIEFASQYYGILKENVYYVEEEHEKAEKMVEIKKQYES